MKSMRSSCEGVTLIEVLVALFVLAVGLLGVISLQAETLKLNQQSFTSTQALFFANDMAERMRANKTVFITDYKDDLGEITHWKTALATQLPGSTGVITNVGGGVFNIAINYSQQALHNEDQSANALASKTITYALRVRL
jgi:type IV pilus assembly protein PilV